MLERINNRLKEVEKISGDELFEYLDELKNSKIFRNSEIEIINNTNFNGKELSTLKISQFTRLMGKFYMYQISIPYNQMGGPMAMTNIPNYPPVPRTDNEFYIRGYFGESQFTHDKETATKLDRLDKLGNLGL